MWNNKKSTNPIDLCMVDIYDSTCEFFEFTRLKIGASVVIGEQVGQDSMQSLGMGLYEDMRMKATARMRATA
jgi:hypothetical protein